VTVLSGFHHVAVLTTDMDRLLEFYRTVFDAPTVLDITEDGVRNAFIDVGGGGLLHAVSVAGAQAPQSEKPKFQRGRLDHIALTAPTKAAFLRVQRRVMEAGASDGRVRDLGAGWSLRFRDPDGAEGEVIWVNPDVPLSSARSLVAWTIVPADQLTPVGA
jgi:catechol 2,3-dioxygenase-like lactoylglutathione lyase family enzyme